jgi:mitogen-activated protein kinase 1/3
MVNACKFVVDVRYSPLKPLGRGAYGVVCSAQDKKTGKKVAIKKIGNAFDDLIDAKRILREVKLLRHFQHPNICGLVDLMPGFDTKDKSNPKFSDIYIVLDFMETDLHKIIYSKNKLTDEHIAYFLYQLLKGLKFIHSAYVMHRDLKPSNLLLNGNCDLQVCDFGLARGVKAEVDIQLTEYVVTRWYRAPEVMCSCSEYDHKIDVWSSGCILAELLGRKPLFPGDDYIKQMNLIFEVLGTPSEDQMSFISNDKAAHYIRQLKKQPKKSFKNLFPDASDNSLDLLEKMLEFNPEHRIGVDEALAHPYFKAFHNEKEPVCDEAFNFDFENGDMPKEVIQNLMWEEIYKFRPELTGGKQM